MQLKNKEQNLFEQTQSSRKDVTRSPFQLFLRILLCVKLAFIDRAGNRGYGMKQVLSNDNQARQFFLMQLLANPNGGKMLLADQDIRKALACNTYQIAVFQKKNGTPFSLCEMQTVSKHIASFPTIVLLFQDMLILCITETMQTKYEQSLFLLLRSIVEQTTGPVYLGVSQKAKDLCNIFRMYQAAKQSLWQMERPQSFPEKSLLQIQRGQQNLFSSFIKNSQQNLEEIIESFPLLDDHVAEDIATTLMEWSGHQYSLFRAVVFLCALELYKKHAQYHDSSLQQILNEAWFVNNREEAALYLKNIMHNIRTMEEKSKSNVGSLLVRNALQYIQAHANMSLTLTDVAQQFYVSVGYLSARIKSETGKPFHVHLANERTKRACELLRDPRQRIGDISASVGYANYVSFLNFFRKQCGMTPTAYRNQFR